MVTRDTKLHLLVLLAYVGLLVAWALVKRWLTPTGTVPTVIESAFGIGLLCFVLVGSHLYLASRGEGGMVPVDARWRFVTVVAIGVVLVIAGTLLAEAPPVAGVEPELPVFGALGALLIGYVLYEAREGYRERRPG